jgi:hypothetical protein
MSLGAGSPTLPASRALNVAEEHEAIGRAYTADLRAAAAHRPTDPVADRLIADLLSASQEFATYWNDMAVEPLRSTRKRMIYPHAGPLDVRCDVVRSLATGQRMVSFRPDPHQSSDDIGPLAAHRGRAISINVKDEGRAVGVTSGEVRRVAAGHEEAPDKWG